MRLSRPWPRSSPASVTAGGSPAMRPPTVPGRRWWKSRIPGVAALAAGAARVVAVDVDPVAVRTARENVERKASVRIEAGSACDVEGEFDIVLANIVARVIAETSADLRARTQPNGTLLVAGIIAEAEDETVAALARAGFRIASRDVQGDWVSLILR